MDVQLVVDAARSWLGTPYHHAAKLKGIGVDCAQLLLQTFIEAGAIEPVEAGFYTMDWHLHRGEERYLDFVERYMRRIDDDERTIDARLAEDASFELPAGTVIVFRVGRTYSHGGMITQWPMFIHSYLPSGIVEEVDIRHTPMSARLAKTYMFEGFTQ
jgi:cell wall-associated NlpC family hydrolase